MKISVSLRRWFLRFYGVHLLTFVVALVVLGTLYGDFIDRTSTRLLGDLFEVTLNRLDSELSGLPKDKWVGAISSYQIEIGAPVHVRPRSGFNLSPDSLEALDKGQIVLLADVHIFIKQIEGSHVVIALGPVEYLSFLHRERWLELLGLSVLALLLGIPAWLAMQPLTRDLLQLDRAARALSRGELTARAQPGVYSPLDSLVHAFNTMAANIETLDQHKKHMASVVSHELRLPLARLRYRLDWIGAQAPQAAAAIQECNDEIEALTELVDEMLLYSRLQQAQVGLSCEAVPTEALLRDVLQRQDLPAHLRVQVHLTATAPAALRANRSSLQRALLNLIGNALRYARSRIDIGVDMDGQHARITVDDDGPGIPEADRQRAFEPFTRLDADTAGHGLGLAIVQQIMRGHGGTVRAEASPLGGARIVLQWPQKD